MSLGRRPRRSPPAFSLIELAVAVAIVVLLAGLVIAAAHHARGQAHDVRCLSNLRQVSVALRLYMMNFDSLPCDHPEADLARDLARYLEDREVLTCPLDEVTPGRSYDPFYVARRSDTSARFVLGCPRHDGKRSAVNLMAESSVQRFPLATVHFTPLHDGPDGERRGVGKPGTPVDPGRLSDVVRPGQAVGAGRMSFEDGSTLTVSGEGRVVLVQSFRKANGVLYTIVRILDADDAEVEVEVAPGSQFEVITPAAIAGVRGTRFTVRIRRRRDGTSATTVAVHEGSVWVQPTAGPQAGSNPVVVPAGYRVRIWKPLRRRATRAGWRAVIEALRR
jgi:hypothetical protein